MMKQIILLICLISLLLQSCMLMNYNVRNELDHPESEEKLTNQIKFKVLINAQSTWNYHDTSELNRAERSILESDYEQITQQIFNSKGIPAIPVTNTDQADFLAEIYVTPFNGALPQEYILAFTFFIIPVWGTRPVEFTYTFEHIGVKPSHSYFVDLKTYAHWIFLPVFWANIMTANETRCYKKALRNYIENSLPEGGGIEEASSTSTRSISMQKYNIYIYHGNNAMDEKKWREAERALLRAMTQVEGGSLPAFCKAEVLSKLANVKLHMGYFDAAVELQEQSIAIYQGNLNSDAITQFANLSIASYQQENFDKADEHFERTLHIIEKLPAENNLNLMITLIGLSAEYYDHGMFAKGAQLLCQTEKLYAENAYRLKLNQKKELKQLISDYVIELRKLGDIQNAEKLSSFAQSITLKRDAGWQEVPPVRKPFPAP